MEKKDIYNCPKCAGIYLIKNKINGKCYIGQSIKLQKRIKAHFNNYNYERYSHIILYKAFKKYGIENFELIILKVFRDALSGYTKQQLDFWEKHYIKQYDTYNNGYNSTLGGDDKRHKEVVSAGYLCYEEDGCERRLHYTGHKARHCN